jgi:hypothetical protein
MTVVDGVVNGEVPDDPKDAVLAALEFEVECLAANLGQLGRIFSSLDNRQTRFEALRGASRRFEALRVAEPRTPRDPDKAVNRRAPHATMLAAPLANAAVLTKPKKKAKKKTTAKKKATGSAK